MKNSSINLMNMVKVIKDNELENFLNFSEIAVLYLQKDGRIHFLTPIITSITGISLDQIGSYIQDTEFLAQNPKLKARIFDFISSANKPCTSSHLLDYSIQLPEIQESIELIAPNKNIYQVLVNPLSEDNCRLNGITLVFYDITKRKHTETALKIEREKYRLLAELTDCAIWEYDIDTKELRHYNKLPGRYSDSYMNIPDYRNTMLGFQWVYSEDIPIFEAYCNSMDRGEDYFQYELRTLSDNNDYAWMRYQGAALHDQNGEVHLIMGRTINIDKERRDHERLLRQSELDPLTGLYNRSATKEKIEKCFLHSSQEKQRDIHCFMIIDFDNFKHANDYYGHLYGDNLLSNFSELLVDIIGINDVAGRLGGDEFIVLIKGIEDYEEIKRIAQAICDMARTQLKGTKENHITSVSVGISIYPFDGSNYEALYKKADTALYEAKARGKNNYVFYEPWMESIEQLALTERSRHKTFRNFPNEEAPLIEKRLLNFAFDVVAESENLDHVINSIFHEIGKFYDLSRIKIFEYGIGNKGSRISYQWVNIGIPKAEFVETDAEDSLMLEYERLFQEYGIHYINDVSEIGRDTPLGFLYDKLGTKSLVQCAIFDTGKFIGTINFEDCVKARYWSKSELDTLYTLTKLISGFIIQIRSKQELNNEIFFTQAMLNNQKLSNYAIREGTYELIYFSEYTENLFPNVKLGEVCYKAIFGRDTPCDPCPLAGLKDNIKRYSIEAYNEQNDFWYSSTASKVVMPDGQGMYLICYSDVTGFMERVKSTDSLTGLITVSKFEAEAMKLIAACDNNQYAILYMDINKFKNINDEWGYSIGNDILIEFSGIVSKLINPPELFCRVVADKFILLLSYQDKEKLIERITLSFEKVEQELKHLFPCVNPIFVSGLYFLTANDKVLSEAMDKANLARKTLKEVHKSNLIIYDDILHESIMKENLIENRMFEALRNQEFHVFMQPKIDLASMKMIGAEALVRWRLPSGIYMSPMEFIPIFERNGFIDELDFYVYEKTFQGLREWLDMGKEEIIVSVNVSRYHLNDSRFIERFHDLVRRYHIPSRLIELEITESIFFKELDRLINIMNSLRERGFLISIDDFGSGYSSLNLLKTLPIDILKLDREFFMQNQMRENDKIIISSIISLAKGLGLKVISEGVETSEQAEFLRENCCDMAQGYLFYKPIPMEDFVQMFQ